MYVYNGIQRRLAQRKKGLWVVYLKGALYNVRLHYMILS